MVHHIGEGGVRSAKTAVGRGVDLDTLGAGLPLHLRGADGCDGLLEAGCYVVGVSDRRGSREEGSGARSALIRAGVATEEVSAEVVVLAVNGV